MSYNESMVWEGGRAVTVVYIDSVFLLNGLMDYLLLLATAQLAGCALRRLRFLLGAVAGGAYAVAVFLPGCAFLSALPVKLACGVLLCLIAFGGERRLFRLVLLFFAVSCAFAGCVLALGLLAGREVPMANGVFYTDVDGKVLLISAATAYLVFTVVFRCSARHGGARGILIPVTVALGDRSVSLTALCDTGNALRDPVTGRQVLVVCGARLGTLWLPALRGILTGEALRRPAELLEILSRGEDGRRFRLIAYQSVGVEGGLLLAFRSDWAEVAGQRYEKQLVALSPTELGSGYDALWGGTEKKGVRELAAIAGKAENPARPFGSAARGPDLLHRGK